MKNVIRKLTLVLGTVFAAGTVMASDQGKGLSTKELLDHAMPEHAQPHSVDKSVSGVNMKCFVDTPAWENYTGPNCRSVGAAYSTSAAFKVFNLPSNTKVVWTTPGCPAYEPTLCLKPINQNQQITAFANIVNKTTGQVVATVSATASYFGFF